MVDCVTVFSDSLALPFRWITCPRYHKCLCGATVYVPNQLPVWQWDWPWPTISEQQCRPDSWSVLSKVFPSVSLLLLSARRMIFPRWEISFCLDFEIQMICGSGTEALIAGMLCEQEVNLCYCKPITFWSWYFGTVVVTSKSQRMHHQLSCLHLFIQLETYLLSILQCVLLSGRVTVINKSETRPALMEFIATR